MIYPSSVELGKLLSNPPTLSRNTESELVGLAEELGSVLEVLR